LLTACGGGAPLMHPAHTLTEGDVSFAAGTSGRVVLGSLHDAEKDLDASAAIPGGATSESERDAFARGAIVRAAVAPGVAPFLAGRVGLGNQNEAGITYTGRGVRIDGRHAFEWPKLALSVGAGVSGALARPGDEPERKAGDTAGDSGLRTATLTSLTGYGVEVPLVFGYRSDADVVTAWIGVRAGFERDAFNLSLVESPDYPLGTTGHASRWWGGGLVGFSVGLSPIEVRVELDGAYERATGTLRLNDGELAGTVAGWSLTPAMAISAKF
jgi:hypothetical protein